MRPATAPHRGTADTIARPTRAAVSATALAAVISLVLACGAPRDSTRRPRDPIADSAFADSVLRAAEDLGATLEVRSSDSPAPARDSVEIRLAFERFAAASYIDELLLARDSTIHRWPDRSRDRLRVWVQTPSAEASEAGFPGAVEDAFRTWDEVGLPVAFEFTGDSSRAEVIVTWVPRYESRTTGRTRWVHDQHGWIVATSIELARAQPDGQPLDLRAVHAIALHEVGHLLGLDHTADERNVMSARVRVSELSEADRTTARLIYSLPPGRLTALP